MATFCAAQHGRLVGSLTLYCGDRDVAEVLAQETLVRVCRDWNRVRTMAAPAAWAHRVGLNLANSWYTRRRAERRATERLSARPDGRRDVDPTDAIAVRQAVATLPPRRRMALILRYYADLPVDQVAALMRCRPGTVKALTAQAVAQLRDRGGLADEEPSDVRPA
jgi:RNA polymerase sigma-70 factor (ECF subfamily)